MLVICYSYVESQINPAETTEKVVESFYKKHNSELQKYTTPESYECFLAVQDMFKNGEAEESNFNLLRDSINVNNAWVKFTTAYEEKPETFKLIKEDGIWKVTESGIREKLF